VIWWVVVVLVAGSLLVLGVSTALLLRRLGHLGVAVRRLRLRMQDAQRLAPAMTALQQRAERLQQEVAAVQERADLLRAARVGRQDS
jgi:hypothetical protein